MEYTRVKKNLFTRLKRGYPFGIKTFAFCFFTAFAAIVTWTSAAGKQLTWHYFVYGFLACIFISLVALILNGTLQHLPDDIIMDANEDEHYKSSFCTDTTLKIANALTEPYYRHEYVHDDVAEVWRKKNPKGFVHIQNKNGDVCASFGIIGLKSSFMEYFIKGKLQDNNLKEEEVLTLEESKKSQTLYISGVVVAEPESTIGHKRALVMIWCMLNYIKKLYGFRKEKTIYALAVSKQSENLLKRFGFQIACNKKDREDKLNLYSFKISKENINSLSMRIGDYSSTCECDFF